MSKAKTFVPEIKPAMVHDSKGRVADLPGDAVEAMDSTGAERLSEGRRPRGVVRVVARSLRRPARRKRWATRVLLLSQQNLPPKPSGRSVRRRRPQQTIPVPGTHVRSVITAVSSVRRRSNILGAGKGKVTTCCTLPETCVGSKQRPHNIRNSFEFCKKKVPYPKLVRVLPEKIPVPETFVNRAKKKKKSVSETSVGSVRKRRPYPKLL